MIRKHMTFSLVLIVLIAAFALVSCDEGNPTVNNGGGGGDPITQNVVTVDLVLNTTSLTGYYGSQDTVEVTATGRDAAGNAVEGATIVVSSSDYGTVEYVSGSKTDAAGQISANLILTYLAFGEANTTDVQASAGGVKSSESMVTLNTLDITVSMTASPTSAVALAGQAAENQLVVQVKNEFGVSVSGVPISLEIINGANARLTEPAFSNADKAYNSTLTVDEVIDVIQIQVRAFVDVPALPQISSVLGIGTELPVIVPGEEAPVLNNSRQGGVEAFDIEEEATPELDGALTGKQAVEVRTWTIDENLGIKGIHELREIADADTVMLTWTTWGSQVSAIQLSVSPKYVNAMPDESVTVNVEAIAKDENNNGIRDLQLYLKLLNTDPSEGVGSISMPGITDSTGRTTATISTNGETGDWIVEARTSPTQDDPWTETLEVIAGSEVVAAFLEVSPNIIYSEPETSADVTVRSIAYNSRNNGVPDFELHMTLRDPDGVPIGASIAQPDSTDSTGTAITMIRTNGDYGDWVVEVRAFENQETPLAVKPLSVREGSLISSINMNVDPPMVYSEPDGNKQIDITATARDANNSSLEERLIYFNLVSEDGSPTGTIAASDTTDSAGVARVVVNSEGNFGLWRVEARAFPTQETPLVSRTINVIEGSDVADISVIVNPNTLTPAPGASDTSYVTLVAYDEFGTGVQDAELNLTIHSISGGLPGVVSEPDSTGIDGSTIAALLTNGRYGTWVIEARPYAASNLVFADTIEVKVGTPQYFHAAADSNRIAVRGTNGLEQTGVTATLYTENDVPTTEDQWVYFKAESFPYQFGDDYRLRINDNYGQNNEFPDPRDPDNGLPFDSVFSVNGEATVDVTSGSSKGHIRLRIWTNDENGDEDIFTQFSGLQVVSGPPAAIEVGVRSEGFEGGGSSWDLEVSARVADARGNDVSDGYTVYFAVDRPDISFVLDQGITGNESEHTATISPGVAFSTLNYHSENTYQTVTITGFVLDAFGNEISDDYVYVLPIIDPTAVLTLSPANFDFGDHEGDYGAFELRLDVYDGHSVGISGQLVSYGPAKGRIFKTNDLNGVMEEFAYTGPLDFPLIPGAPDDPDDPGVSNRWFLITEGEAFPDPSVGETQVQITADLIGVPDASVEPATVFLIRDISPE
jgi:hypothetical protein